MTAFILGGIPGSKLLSGCSAVCWHEIVYVQTEHGKTTADKVHLHNERTFKFLYYEDFGVQHFGDYDITHSKMELEKKPNVKVCCCVGNRTFVH